MAHVLPVFYECDGVAPDQRSDLLGRGGCGDELGDLWQGTGSARRAKSKLAASQASKVSGRTAAGSHRGDR